MMILTSLMSSWAGAGNHWEWLLAAFIAGLLIGWLSGGPGTTEPDKP